MVSINLLIENNNIIPRIPRNTRFNERVHIIIIITLINIIGIHIDYVYTSYCYLLNLSRKCIKMIINNTLQLSLIGIIDI